MDNLRPQKWYQMEASKTELHPKTNQQKENNEEFKIYFPEFDEHRDPYKTRTMFFLKQILF